VAQQLGASSGEAHRSRSTCGDYQGQQAPQRL